MAIINHDRHGYTTRCGLPIFSWPYNEKANRVSSVLQHHTSEYRVQDVCIPNMPTMDYGEPISKVQKSTYQIF